MKCISLLLLLFIEQIQGSTEMIQKFLLTGMRSSIGFLADDLPKECAVSLSYDLNITIGTCYCDEDPQLGKNFIGKVELSCPASLIFLSPQKSDCGVYSAQVIGEQSKIVKYNITFQDPVSPVELKSDVISKSCDRKVTCSTEDVEINGTVRCDDKACRLEGGKRSKATTSGASLTLYQSNESIICNHSNQVNWTQNKTEIQPCLRSEGSTDKTTLIAVVSVVAGLFVAAIAAGGVLFYCLKKRQMEPPPASQDNGDPGSDRTHGGNTEESSVGLL